MPDDTVKQADELLASVIMQADQIRKAMAKVGRMPSDNLALLKKVDSLLDDVLGDFQL